MSHVTGVSSIWKWQFCAIDGSFYNRVPLFVSDTSGHNLTSIASQFAMHLGFTCDVISVTHRSD